MKTMQSQTKMQIKKELPVFYNSDHNRNIKPIQNTGKISSGSVAYRIRIWYHKIADPGPDQDPALFVRT